ncbi:MAG TPA: diacylglycerol kinase family protein [Flavisolibacter sp.]|jgi:YegS/Rv2252/BmrU family lipid kinase|nr:diacylglycerol kinase family protein [Flavisolibacter sp.]
MKLLFVINPISGGKTKTDWETHIREYFKTSEHQMEFFILSGKGDESSVNHYIDTIRPDRVAAVGGDGTIKMIAEIVQHKDIPLAIIPAGSANGMAKELNIPADIDVALEIAVNGEVKPIDLIRINDKEICIHLSDLGLNAMLVKYFEASKARGMWSYGKAIFRVMWEKQKMYVTIASDDTEIKRKAYMVVLANARKYGTGANINPEGDVSDGYFEVVIVRKLNVIEIMKAILTNKPFEKRRIEVIKTKKAMITTLKRTYFQVDGEYRGKIDRLTASIAPAQLKLLQPKVQADQ